VNPPVVGPELEPQPKLPKKQDRREDVKFAAGKIAIFQYAGVAIFLFLITGFWNLQVQNPQIYNEQAERNRIKALPIPAPRGNVHPIPTDANYPEGAANLYAEALQTFYGADKLDPARPLFDLVLMGLGPDGHVASLYPQSRALDEKQRWVLGVAKAGWEPFVPRVTLTFPTLASTREMLFLVDGADKRDILHRVFSGEDLPGARVYCNGDLVWMLDRAAAPERVS